MSESGFTSGQRFTVLVMILAVIVVFATLAGFIVTSLQSLDSPSLATPSPAFTASPAPPPTPSSTSAPLPEEGIWSQVQAARLFDQIAHQVETSRGLSPRAEVPLTFLDEREMAALLRRLHTQRNPQARLLPYVILGLLPDASVSIQVHQVASLYVPEQEQLYIATGRALDSEDDQLLLAHAHAHALQDQHFDLGAMDTRATTSDSTLAVEALIEGDATLLTAFYHYQDPAEADWEHLVSLLLEAEQASYGAELDANATWARIQSFPYREGRLFAAALFQAGGWEALNRAYTAPPRSTEQVLHPERYLGGQADPAHVVVPYPGVALDEEWELLLRDTLGEFVIGLYLGTFLPEETAWQAADGWGGDTFVAWEQEGGGQVRVWRTIWDSGAEAQEFERALVATVPHRYLLAQPVDPPAGLEGQWWETSSEAVYISRVARYVTFAEAPDAGLLADLVEALP